MFQKPQQSQVPALPKTAQAAQIAAALARAQHADASTVAGVRTPFPAPGRHETLIASIDVDASKDGKCAVWVQLVITASNTEPAPKLVTQYFDLLRPAAFPGSPTAAALFKALIMAATGASTDVEAQKAVELALDLDQMAAQPLRGFGLVADGRYAKKPSKDHAVDPKTGRQYAIVAMAPSGPVLDTAKERYVYWSYEGAEQSEDEVAQARAWLDEHFPIPTTTTTAEPAPPPAAPAPGGFRLPGR